MTIHQAHVLRQDVDQDELYRRMERLRDGNARLHATQRQTIHTLEQTCRDLDALLHAVAVTEMRRRDEAASLTATGHPFQAACAAAVADQLADLLHRFGNGISHALGRTDPTAPQNPTGKK